MRHRGPSDARRSRPCVAPYTVRETEPHGVVRSALLVTRVAMVGVNEEWPRRHERIEVSATAQGGSVTSPTWSPGWEQ